MASKVHPRPEVAALQPDVHGGLDHGELAHLGLAPDDLLDFSVNSNPFGPPPEVHAIWDDLAIARYPDRACLALRAALAEHHRCPMEQVWVGNGAAELIWLLALAYLRPGDEVLIVSPTFGEYAVTSRLMGARAQTCPTRPQDDFRLDVDALITQMETLRPRLTFLCNPNNPTGTYIDRATVEALLAANPSGLLILDEAYVAFVRESWDSTPLLETEHIVVLRSMTKDCAMAGLRLGYVLADPEIVASVRRVQPPWSVNAVARAAGVAALSEGAQGFIQSTVAQTLSAKETLVQDITALGLRIYPSATHFFLVEVADAPATRAGLMAHGMLVRDCTSFGLPTCVRIAARRPEENQQLVAAWKKILDQGT
jgi:histidinol-phosphate aminotransferase